MKILTEIDTEINLPINEERTEEEFLDYLFKLITENLRIPNTTDIMLSQYRSNTYVAKVRKTQVNSEQDLSLFLDIPLRTVIFQDLLTGFTVGDCFFIAEGLLPDNLKEVFLRKLIFVGTDKVILEVKGVSPSLVTDNFNTFEYREDLDGGYLYWYNQHPAQIGCLAFSTSDKTFMSGFISLASTKNLPQINVPKLYAWVEANRDNILSIDEENKLVLFPEAVGSYLQIRDESFALDVGSETIPVDTITALSERYAASNQFVQNKILSDVSGESLLYMSPTSVPREEKVSLVKGGLKSTRFENSRGINILIKAI